MKSGGVLQRMLRHYSPKIVSRGRLIRRFANKTGLVYFGTVDQHDDDHEVIRGLTVSMTHKDSHFTVGSFDGYDISLVDRFDVLHDSRRKLVQHSWLIMKVGLENKSIPHIFFKPVGHSPSAYNRFFTANNTLHTINDVFYGAHSQEFHARYDLYGVATHALELEQTLTPEVTQTIAARFWPHAIEVFDGNLYVYITEHRLNETVLTASLESATWLASILDKKPD